MEFRSAVGRTRERCRRSGPPCGPRGTDGRPSPGPCPADWGAWLPTKTLSAHRASVTTSLVATRAVQVNMPDDRLREIGVRLGGVFVGLGSEFAFGFLGHQIRADEWIEIAVEGFVHVADFKFGSMVLN